MVVVCALPYDVLHRVGGSLHAGVAGVVQRGLLDGREQERAVLVFATVSWAGLKQGATSLGAGAVRRMSITDVVSPDSAIVDPGYGQQKHVSSVLCM